MTNKNIYIVIILLLLSLTDIVKANIEFDTTSYGYRKFKSSIMFGAGFPFGMSSPDFFNEYSGKLIKGTATSFTTVPSIVIIWKKQIFKYFRIGVSSEFNYSNLTDGYFDYVKYTPIDSGKRTFNQNIAVYGIPLFLNFDAIPVLSPYATYAGIGLGLTVGKIKWDEFVSSPKDNDIRAGGTMFNDYTISPAIRLYTGMELGFDNSRKNNFLGSLVIDINYTYIFRRVKIFDKIRKEFKAYPANWETNFTILPSYIGINMGLTFNFNTDK